MNLSDVNLPDFKPYRSIYFTLPGKVIDGKLNMNANTNETSAKAIKLQHPGLTSQRIYQNCQLVYQETASYLVAGSESLKYTTNVKLDDKNTDRLTDILGTDGLVISHFLMDPKLVESVKSLVKFTSCDLFYLFDDNERHGPLENLILPDNEWGINVKVLTPFDQATWDNNWQLVRLKELGYEILYWPYCWLAYADTECKPFNSNPYLDANLIYLGASKPYRVNRIDELQAECDTLIWTNLWTTMPNEDMLKEYNNSLASIFLISPGQEGCVTPRYFESLCSGRYVFFDTNAGAPPSLTFNNGRELQLLAERAKINDPVLWEEQMKFLTDLKAGIPPKFNFTLESLN